jgi:hypothetical protein
MIETAPSTTRGESMPPRPSRAREFFTEVHSSSDPAARIRELAGPGRGLSEEEWLDCKADPLSDPRMGKAPRKDREVKLRSIWFEALCGFANVSDGVLIWGLDARKGDDGADVIRECVPVEDPHALRSRLKELLRGATDTPLSGVEVEAYEDPRGSGKGYVICFIPEGQFKPYRAETKGAKQYIIRAQDQFVVAPSSLLRTLFYPRTQAHFEVTARVEWRLAPHPRRDAEFGCSFSVKNIGTVSARNLEITLDAPHTLKDLGIGGIADRWVTYTLSGGLSQLTLQRALHSGVTTGEFRLQWVTPTTNTSGNRAIPQSPDIDFRLSLYAENQPPQYARLQFGMDELTLPAGVREGARTVAAEETQPW